jgi:hypothetical protein
MPVIARVLEGPAASTTLATHTATSRRSIYTPFFRRLGAIGS